MILKFWNKFVNRESISYIIFGVLTTAVDWVTYAALWRLGTDYRVSTAVSWCAAVLFAFVTNKIWVFQSYEMRLSYLGKEFLSFVACRAFSGVVTMVAMIIMVDYLFLNEFVAKLIVSAICLVLNYVFSKLFIFKKKLDGEEEQHGTRGSQTGF